MKYLVFAFALLCGVPAMALLSAASVQARRWMLALLIMSPVLGSAAGINFVSLEKYRGPDRGFEVTVSDLIALGLTVALVVRAPRTVRWVPPNAFLMALYFGVNALSLAWSPEPLFSAFTLFKLLRCGLCYWIVYNLVRAREDLVAVVSGWTVAAILVTLAVLKQKYLQGIWRASGPFDHSNTMPVFLNLALPAVLAWGLVGARSVLARALALAATIGIVFCSLASFSRAGIVISSCTFATMLALALLRHPSPRTGIIGLLAVAIAVCGGLRAAPRVIERFQTADEESLEARQEFNAAALALVSDHPQGVGANTFPLAMDQPKYMEFVRVMANEESPGVVHNIYLLIAAELGLAGLALFLAMMARFLMIALTGAWRPASFESLVAAGTALGMLATHAAGLLEWVLCIAPVMYQFAFVSGVAAALAKR